MSSLIVKGDIVRYKTGIKTIQVTATHRAPNGSLLISGYYTVSGNVVNRAAASRFIRLSKCCEDNLSSTPDKPTVERDTRDINKYYCSSTCPDGMYVTTLGGGLIERKKGAWCYRSGGTIGLSTFLSERLRKGVQVYPVANTKPPKSYDKYLSYCKWEGTRFKWGSGVSQYMDNDSLKDKAQAYLDWCADGCPKN